MLDRSFFERPAEDVAKDLIGCVLVHRLSSGRILKSVISETEAYVGEHDLASHASKGRTPRTNVMYGPAGHAYVYLIYGMYELFNVVTSVEGDPQAVLIRAGIPLNALRKDLKGPGKFSLGMAITRAKNSTSLTQKSFHFERYRKPTRVQKTPRIGVPYAGAWRDKELRFVGSFDGSERVVTFPI